MIRLLFLLLAWSSVSLVTAQHLRLEGISIASDGRNGQATLPTYADFITATKAPSLFRGATREDAVADGTTALSNLAIDFDFSLSGRERHAFSVGFARQTLTTTLYAMPAADTLSPGIDLTAANEYFSLRGGYRFRLRPNRKVSAFAGLSLEVGTPVSALSKETIGGDSLGHESQFFARRAGLWAIRLPLGLRLKLTRAMHLTLALNPSRVWARLDGSRMATNLFGVGMGVQFRFRRRDG